MAFTYSGDPSSSSRDLVRFLIADTNPAVPLFTDAEIAAALTTRANPYWCAVDLVDAAVARYAFTPDKSIDGMNIRWSTVVANLKTLRVSLVARATSASETGGAASMYAGGISEAERLGDELDTELSQPAFRRNQFVNKEDPP